MEALASDKPPLQTVWCWWQCSDSWLLACLWISSLEEKESTIGYFLFSCSQLSLFIVYLSIHTFLVINITKMPAVFLCQQTEDVQGSAHEDMHCHWNMFLFIDEKINGCSVLIDLNTYKALEIQESNKGATGMHNIHNDKHLHIHSRKNVQRSQRNSLMVYKNH